MGPLSSSSSAHYPNSLSTQTDQSTNSISSPPQKNPFEITELEREIKKNIMDDRRVKFTYLRALIIPTTKSGDTFVSFPHTFFLMKKQLDELEAGAQKCLTRLEAIEIEKGQDISQERMAKLEIDKSACEKEKNTLEEDRFTFERKVFGNNVELRAFMLECPPPNLFNTRNAERFTSRYELVASYLTLDECNTALRGFKGFLDAGAYTQNSPPNLNKAKKIQGNLLKKWLKLFSTSPQIDLQKYKLIKDSFLKDLEGPRLPRGRQSADEKLGIALRSLAEGPTQGFSQILKEMALNLLFPRGSTKIYLNPLVYQALIKYFPSLPQEEIRSIVKKLGSDYLGALPMELRSIVFEKIQFFSQEEEFSNFIIEIIEKLSFPEKISLLKLNSRLPHNVVLDILKNSLDNIEDEKNISLLIYCYNYFKNLTENKFNKLLNNFVELLENIYELDLSKCDRTRPYSNEVYGSPTIVRENQSTIIEILDSYMEIIPGEAISQILMGITEIWEFFHEPEKYKLMDLLGKYLPVSINKNKIFANMIKNWGDLFKKDRPKIIEYLTPYLDGSSQRRVSLSILKKLTEKWQDLSVDDQKKVLDWMSSYLAKAEYQDKHPELLKAIQDNLKKLFKTAETKASTLLKRANV